MKLNHKDVLIRAAKTFVEAFVGVFVVAFGNLFSLISQQGLSASKSVIIALLGSGLAAGITAVWNYTIQLKTSS